MSPVRKLVDAPIQVQLQSRAGAKVKAKWIDRIRGIESKRLGACVDA